MHVLRSLVLCACVASGCAAQTASPQPAPQQPSLTSESYAALLDKIDRLEKRVAELEARQAVGSGAATAISHESPQQVAAQQQASTPAPPAAPAPAQTVQAAHDHDSVEVATGETYPSLKIRGFGDVDFGANNIPHEPSGFNVGQFVLHFASALSPKVSYFAEVSLTAQPTGYNVDLERTIIKYAYNDALALSFGRYHTPINYWNTAYHHGAWLQTTIARPDMIQFGGKFLPVHFVGADTNGALPSGGLGLHYDAGIGNGRSSLISRAGDNGDVNDNRAWFLTVYSQPPKHDHLQIGASIYQDEISLTTQPALFPNVGTQFHEWISSGRLIWVSETPEILAEFANVRNISRLTGQEYNSQGGYVQFAYRLPIWQHKWKPYYRYDYIAVPGNEPVFQPFTDVRRSTLGTRYDITDFAAFKFEYRNGRGVPGQPARVEGVYAQTSFTF